MDCRLQRISVPGLILVVMALTGVRCKDDAPPEPSACCTAADCEPQRQRCNDTSCACEPIPCGREPGRADLCPIGTYCKLAVGLTGVCVESECSDFFVGECGAGMKCAPMNSHAYACEVNGTGVAGSGCVDDGDCGADLLCYREECTAPDCSPRGTSALCVAEGHICQRWDVAGEDLDVGECIEPCTAFQAGACPQDQWCYPEHPDSGTGLIAGRCVPDAGSIRQGGACADDVVCDRGLACIGPPGLSTCQTLCDWNAAPGEVGYTCVPPADCVPTARPSGTLEQYGFCSLSCQAFVVGQCEPGDWCFPDRRDHTSGDLYGVCLPGGGTVDNGGSCAAGASLCADNLACVGSDATAVCRTICDTEAASSAPGATCTSEEACTELYVDVGGAPIKAVYGACLPGCDYDAHRTCVDTSKDCIPGELALSATDLCVVTPNLAEFADCTPAGLAERAFCNATSGCYDIYTGRGPPWPEGVRCFELCRADVQALDTTNHPDCTRATARCVAYLGTIEFGICAP
jgi:hypothetical protein